MSFIEILRQDIVHPLVLLLDLFYGLECHGNYSDTFVVLKDPVQHFRLHYSIV